MTCPLDPRQTRGLRPVPVQSIQTGSHTPSAAVRSAVELHGRRSVPHRRWKAGWENSHSVGPSAAGTERLSTPASRDHTSTHGARACVPAPLTPPGRSLSADLEPASGGLLARHQAISVAHLPRAAARWRAHVPKPRISSGCARDLGRLREVRGRQRAQQFLDAPGIRRSVHARSLRSSPRARGPSALPRRPSSSPAGRRPCIQAPVGFLISSPFVVGLGQQRRREVVVKRFTSPSNMPAIFAVTRGRCAGAPPRTRPDRPSA